MITVIRRNSDTFGRRGNIPETEVEHIICDMKIVLALAAQRENNEIHSWQGWSWRQLLAGLAVSAMIISISVAMSVGIGKVPQKDDLNSQTLSVSRKSALSDMRTMPSYKASPSYEANPNREREPAPEMITRSGTGSTARLDPAIVHQPARYPELTVPSSILDIPVTQAVHQRESIADVQDAPIRALPKDDTAVPHPDPLREDPVVDAMTIDVRYSHLEAQAEVSNRLAAIDALKALRAR